MLKQTNADPMPTKVIPQKPYLKLETPLIETHPATIPPPEKSINPNNKAAYCQKLKTTKKMVQLALRNLRTEGEKNSGDIAKITPSDQERLAQKYIKLEKQLKILLDIYKNAKDYIQDKEALQQIKKEQNTTERLYKVILAADRNFVGKVKHGIAETIQFLIPHAVLAIFI